MAKDVIKMAMPDINSEAAIHIIILIIIVDSEIEKDMVLNNLNDDEAIIILTIVRIKPINEAIKPVITVAKYFPVINSLALIGKVRIVSSVPFSFSTAVADVAILVAARTIAIII